MRVRPALPTMIEWIVLENGSQGGIRTPDRAVNSRLLYH